MGCGTDRDATPPSREPESIERDLARFMAGHLGPGLPPPGTFTELLRLTVQLGTRLPPQTSTMFRAWPPLRERSNDSPPDCHLNEMVAALGGAELQERTSRASLTELVQIGWAQLGPWSAAPRGLDRIATRAEHGALTARDR